MNSINNWLRYFFFACISLRMIAASDKMVIYWGQNSIGTFTNNKTQWEKPLRTYCEDATYDIIVVGFVYLFPVASGSTYPGMNFANHCEVPFDNANPYVLNCTANIAPDITYCQQRGKTILLSFGGGVGTYGFTSESQGATFATTIWNMFLGGSHPMRPFGNAIFDGVDLDIEGGTSVGYNSLISTLRGYFAAGSKTYYISAAPQCFYPDRLGPGVGTPFNSAWFDFIWIQFYNNHCGLDEPANFNFAKWASWAATAVNPNMKVMIGAPASSDAAASGFVPIETLRTIAATVKATHPNLFGGMMIWDASLSDANNNFGSLVSQIVHGSSSYTPTPVTTASVVPGTTGRVSSSSYTTGRVASIPSIFPSAPLTTASSAPVALPTTAQSVQQVDNVPSTSGKPIVAPATSSSPSSSSGTCDSGKMKCISDNTYSTCDHQLWQSAQKCPSGTSCSSAGDFIYCLPSSSVKPNVVPTLPTQTPNTVVISSVSTTASDSSAQQPAKPSLSNVCVLGDQQCIGSNTYRTCGNGPNGPAWASIQACQVGLTCHPSSTGNNVYCY